MSDYTDVEKNYTYPDGSICYVCQYDSDAAYTFVACGFMFDIMLPESSIYCTAPGGACDGQYTPTGYKDNGGRIIASESKCAHISYDEVNLRREGCCFKPGSTVCISNFLVYYSGLMLRLELV